MRFHVLLCCSNFGVLCSFCGFWWLVSERIVGVNGMEKNYKDSTRPFGPFCPYLPPGKLLPSASCLGGGGVLRVSCPTEVVIPEVPRGPCLTVSDENFPDNQYQIIQSSKFYFGFSRPALFLAKAMHWVSQWVSIQNKL